MAKTLRERTIAWALQSESAQRIRACLEIARCLPPIADGGAGWDEVYYKMAVGEAVINLPLGTGEPGVKEDKMSLSTNVRYNPQAEAPRWRQFLKEIFVDDDLINYIQLAVGYSLTGETSEQCFFMCYGKGANGKTTFLAALRHVMGDYAYVLPFAVIERPRRGSGGENASPYLADLAGRRFVTASEYKEGAKLNEARIKELTGEGVLTARPLYKQPFTYVPQCKLWIAVNHKPQIDDDSDAFWRRVRFIPFNETFEGGAIDTSLAGKLAAEVEGILRWAVEGVVRWYKLRDENDGRPVLGEVPGADEFVKEWRGDSDPIQEFLDAYCVVKPDCRVERSSLYEAYADWANSVSLPTKERLTRTSFIRRVAARFKTQKSGNARFFKGLELIVEPKTPEAAEY